MSKSFVKQLENKSIPKSKKDSKEHFANVGLNIIGKKKEGISKIMGSEIMLTKNEMKDIAKVMRSLANRAFL